METVATQRYAHDAGLVFDVICSIVSKHYNIKATNKAIRCIEASSRASLLSFGETFEVIVVAQDNGSVVRVKTRPKVFWNITSDMKGITKKIFDSLEEDLN